MALPAFVALLATHSSSAPPELALFAAAVLLANVWGGRDFQSLAPRLWALLLVLAALALRASRRREP
jgi:hypothetical protein